MKTLNKLKHLWNSLWEEVDLRRAFDMPIETSTTEPVKEEQAVPASQPNEPKPSLEDLISAAENTLAGIKNASVVERIRERWQHRIDKMSAEGRVGSMHRLTADELAKPGIPTNRPSIYIPAIQTSSDARDFECALATLQRAIDIMNNSHTYMSSALQDKAESFIKRFKEMLDLARPPKPMTVEERTIIEVQEEQKPESEVIPKEFTPSGDFEAHKSTYMTPAEVKAEIAKSVRPPTAKEIKAVNASVKEAIALGLDPNKHNLKEVAGLSPNDLVPNGYVYRDFQVENEAMCMAKTARPNRRSGPANKKKPAKKTKRTTTKKKSR